MNYGFWIRGSLNSARHLVDADTALGAYAKCNTEAKVGLEAYLSAFVFADDFKNHLTRHGSVRGFDGPCSARYIHWDIDRPNLEIALEDTRRLSSAIRERYGEPLVFFSGSKGFHVCLPVDFAPARCFNRIARHFATNAAADVVIDQMVYDKVRPLRAPNSRHPKSGLHKVRLSVDELSSDVQIIQMLATNPRPFEFPAVGLTEQARLDWEAATVEVQQCTDTQPFSDAKLFRLTLEFLREGAPIGQRATRLFAAAANLADFGCPPSLAHALLSEPALDSGLSPSEVHRQIECGLGHGARGPKSRTLSKQ